MAPAAVRDHHARPSSHSLLPLLSLLCFVSIFLALSLFRTASPTQPLPSKTLQLSRNPKSYSGGSCDYSVGSWIYDPTYGSGRYDSSCKEIFKGWNCIAGNKSNAWDVTNWRWKPQSCDLSLFNPIRFMESHRDTNIGTVSLSPSLLKCVISVGVLRFLRCDFWYKRM